MIDPAKLAEIEAYCEAAGNNLAHSFRADVLSLAADYRRLRAKVEAADRLRSEIHSGYASVYPAVAAAIATYDALP